MIVQLQHLYRKRVKMNHLLILFNIVLLSRDSLNALPNLSLEAEHSNEEEQSYKHCVCVPFWQCKEDFSGIDGDGINIMDVRNMKSDETSPSACTGYFDVCCKVQCGMRKISTSSILANYDKIGKRILGEHNTAEFGEFPWMLGILKGQIYQCGASLIHPKIALTAAHCVQMPAKYIVRAGEWDWEHTNEPMEHQDREVKEILTHPKFHAGSLKNDIALLILNSPFKLTRHVGIICLPPQNLKVDINSCIASGWGRNSFRKSSYQSVLKKINLPLMERDKCARVLKEAVLGPFFTLHGSFICAGGEPNKDTCKGDGGSPLICPVLGETGRYEQIGIVSWGLTCGLSNSPGVYVNVMTFSNWIDTQMFRLSLDTDIYRHK